MKRIILAALCVMFSVGLFAQKGLIIHMKDGTKLEIPFKGIYKFDFLGKAVVNDGDYTSISNLALHSGENIDITFTVNNHYNDPNITTVTGYGQTWGVIYSTTPNVSIETGNILDQNIQKNDQKVDRSSWDILLGESPKFSGVTNNYCVDLEYETTYYIRSFLYNSKYNKYYYSKEECVNIGKPSMAHYGVKIDTAPFAETGYVMPTDSAWNSFVERYPYFNIKGSCKETITECWHNYMNKNIATLKSQCKTTYDCCDGTLYILDNIGDDFGKYALDYYDDAFTMSGYATSVFSVDSTAHVTCDASWNIPNNEYWEYHPLSKTSNQKAEIKLSKPLMASYIYNVEITLAPDVTGADTLPTKYDVIIYGLNEFGKNTKTMEVKNFITNAQSATITTIDSVSVGGFGEASVHIKQAASRRDTDFSRILRISQIKVIPIGPMKKDDE